MVFEQILIFFRPKSIEIASKSGPAGRGDYDGNHEPAGGSVYAQGTF